MREIYEQAMEMLMNDHIPDGWDLTEKNGYMTLLKDGDPVVMGFRKDQMIMSCRNTLLAIWMLEARGVEI